MHQAAVGGHRGGADRLAKKYAATESPSSSSTRSSTSSAFSPLGSKRVVDGGMDVAGEVGLVGCLGQAGRSGRAPTVAPW